MEIYIEYAFIENFLFDWALLYLATKSARVKSSHLRLIFSSICGALFALLFPLLSLPKLAAMLLKLSAGLLLCLLAVEGIKTKKERGRYALTCVFFFIFSFLFGGVLLFLTEGIFEEKPPSLLIIGLFFVLTRGACILIEKIYATRKIERYIYDCDIIHNKKRLTVRGFLDSGNLAMKNHLPICFLSPQLFYALYEEEIFSKQAGQGFDEMKIQTVNGEKSVYVYRGELQVHTANKKIKKQVYFAPSKNIISREYSLLMPAAVLDEEIPPVNNKNKKSA